MVSRAAQRRVVITGIGLISPLGHTPTDAWDALASRRSGVGPLALVPPAFLPMGFAGEARAFTGQLDDFGPVEGELKKAIRKGLKVMCRECQMGVAAAQRALHDAGVVGRLDPDRSGVVFGSDYMLSEPQEFSSGIRRAATDGAVPPARWAADGLQAMSPLWLLKYLPNMPACHVAIYHDLRGPSNSLTLREASSNAAVGEALRVIQRGGADLLVAGATGTRLHPMKTLHAVLQEEVAGNGTSPQAASRPFDRRRTGMVLGEGAGVVILEDVQSALRRGARIYAEVLGFGSSSVADRRGVADRRRALANAMRIALADAQLAPEKLGHVHAHGLATRTCDVEEAAALTDALGAAADRVPVAAAKSYFGNLGAGSGAVELICSLLALDQGRLFTTLNYEEPDPECPVRVVRSPETPAGDTFVNLNVTPQGQASAVVVGRFVE